MEMYELPSNTDSIDSILFSGLDIWHVDMNQSKVSGVILRMEFCEVRGISCLVTLNH